MIKNIILDAGRVLVAWDAKHGMRELGFSEDVIEVLNKAFFTTGIWDEVDRAAKENEEILAMLIEQAPEYEAEVRKFWENIDVTIWEMPYTRNWLREMKRKGYKTYVLSNYGSWGFEKTREKSLSFLDEMDGSLFSYEVKIVKPEPGIYQALLERYVLKAEECIFLDDRAENIEGAKQAGMHGIVFETLEKALEDLKEYGVELEIQV